MGVDRELVVWSVGITLGKSVANVEFVFVSCDAIFSNLEFSDSPLDSYVHKKS